MKIRLLVSRAGVDFSQVAGEVVEVTADEAKRMVEAGQAVPERESKPEKAVRRVKSEKASK